MMQLRSLLSLCLLPSVAAMGLRAHTSERGGQSEEPHHQQRSLLNSNQLLMQCQYTMELSSDGPIASAGPTDISDFTTVAQGWLAATIGDAEDAQVVPPNADGTAGTGWEYRSMSNTVRYTTYYPDRKHVMSVRYTIDFDNLVAPSDPPAWVDDVEDQIDTADLVSRATNNRAGGTVFGYLSTVSVTCEDVPDTSGRRRWDEAYVLPYRLNWNFNTTNSLADPIEFEAAVNATEKWIADNWEVQYGALTSWGTRCALENIDIFTRYTAFSPSSSASGNARYQQQMGLYVQLVVGADNITDVPTVANYLETLQLFYPLGDFVADLVSFQNQYMPAGMLRILPGTQQSYSVIPTFDVSEVSDTQARSGKFADIMYTDYVTVSVTIDNPNVAAAGSGVTVSSGTPAAGTPATGGTPGTPNAGGIGGIGAFP